MPMARLDLEHRTRKWAHFWDSTGFLGMSADVLERTCGKHRPNFIREQPEPSSGKTEAVAAIVAAQGLALQTQQATETVLLKRTNTLGSGGPGRRGCRLPGSLCRNGFSAVARPVLHAMFNSVQHAQKDHPHNPSDTPARENSAMR